MNQLSFKRRFKSFFTKILPVLFLSFGLNAQSVRDVLNECAATCLIQHNYLDAIDAYTQVISIYPKDSNAYFDRGYVYELMEDYHTAIEDYSLQITIDSNHVDSYFLRGIVYNRIGKYEDAFKDYSKVLSLEDGNADAHYFRGIIQENKGDLESAINDYSDAILVNPEHVEALAHRAWLQTRLKNYQSAEVDLERILNIDRMNAQAYLCRGYIAGELNDFEKAITYFLEAVRFNATFEVVIPCCYSNMKKLDKYSYLLELKIAEDSFLFANDLRNYAALQNYFGKYDKALKLINQAVVADPLNAEFQASRVIVLLNLNDTSTALSAINNAIELNPNCADYYYQRATILNDLGRFEEACIDYLKYKDIIGYAKYFIFPNPCTI